MFQVNNDLLFWGAMLVMTTIPIGFVGYLMFQSNWLKGAKTRWIVVPLLITAVLCMPLDPLFHVLVESGVPLPAELHDYVASSLIVAFIPLYAAVGLLKWESRSEKS